MKKTIVALCLGVALCATAQAATWRGVIDDDGTIWARVKIVNESGWAVSLAVWNCRTAVFSTEDSAETSLDENWDAEVEAGTTEYVWVYGGVRTVDGETGEVSTSDLAVNISSDDGVAYRAEFVPAEDGDGEWVITVNADGEISGDIETVAVPYGQPTLLGN